MSSMSNPPVVTSHAECDTSKQSRWLDVRHFQKITACASQFITKAFVPATQNRIIAALCPVEDENLECLQPQTRLTLDITPSQSLARICIFTRTRTYSSSFAGAVNVLTTCQQPFTFHFKILA